MSKRSYVPGALSKIRVSFLGGIGEIGKNMMVIEDGEDMLIVDAGLTFPEEDMLGIDVVIPDFSYVLENASRVKAVVITHGHEDHTGALPFLMDKLDAPVYSSRLALGLVNLKLAEYGIDLGDRARTVKRGDKITAGRFEVEFFRVNHSIPDSFGVAITTSAGLLVHTGDFKFDQTPVDGQVADFSKLTEFGERGVLVLFSDSTNADEEGYTPSERSVGRVLSDIFADARGRVLVATFSSNVHRIQQVITAAHELGKNVALVGRSMEKVVQVASELGYIHIPNGTLVDVDFTKRLPSERVVLLTTGSQGEPLSALTRIATDDHRKVEISPDDTVVIAATPIPGNEKLVSRTVDHLFQRGAEVVYEESSGVHVSGHARREELKLMLNLVKPQFFVPVHGEYRHLVRHADLAEAMGIPRANVFVTENGTQLEFTPVSGRVSGRVGAGNVLVDGLGVGDVGNVVLRDRRMLSHDGILVAVLTIAAEDGKLLAGPDLVSRGFVYVRESEELLEEARLKVKEAIEEATSQGTKDWSSLKSAVKDTLGKYLYERTRRRPIILPIIMEV